MNIEESRTLTDREYRIAKLVSDGLRNRDIGAEIGRTELVVKNYLHVIYDKVGVWNRLELALWYLKGEQHK